MNTLVLDVGCSFIKAALVAADRGPLGDPIRRRTPYPFPPAALMAELSLIVRRWSRFDRVSIGFPGVVKAGIVRTAPVLSTHSGAGSLIDPEIEAKWRGFPLAETVSSLFGRPTRALNDADMHGLGAICGSGRELVVTLGTGVGTALFYNGALLPHLELAHHPFVGGQTYNDSLGDAYLRSHGVRQWRKNVLSAITVWQTVFGYSRLLMGGGNAVYVNEVLATNVITFDQVASFIGGSRLWDEAVFRVIIEY